jgi:hypothetical protein
LKEKTNVEGGFLPAYKERHQWEPWAGDRQLQLQVLPAAVVAVAFLYQ